MNEQCNFTNANGYRCGSYAFNLYKEQIDQGDRCDHHYWQEQAMKAAAHEREECAKLCDYYYKSWINIEGRYEFMGEGAQECAEAIRARGEV